MAAEVKGLPLVRAETCGCGCGTGCECGCGCCGSMRRDEPANVAAAEAEIKPVT